MPENNNYTICLIHRGKFDYLLTSLQQAHFSNPNSRIILLGDETNKNTFDFVEHYNISDYFSTAKEFAKIYKNLSFNKEAFELFCIQRWFVLNEFLNKNNIDKCIHIDSDVLLYSDFSKDEEYIKKINSYDMTISGWSPHCMFINNIAMISKFCDYITDKYNDENLMQEISEAFSNRHFYKTWDFSTSPVSDMFWLNFFPENSCAKVFDTDEVVCDSMVNNNIDVYSMFARYNTFGHLLNVLFNKKTPYIFDLEDNKLVRLHNLHCQGSSKRLMSKYATYDKKENEKIPQFNKFDLSFIFDTKLGFKFFEFYNDQNLFYLSLFGIKIKRWKWH
jgi:hypothetical protein